jgi:hypothetical protein
MNDYTNRDNFNTTLKERHQPVELKIEFVVFDIGEFSFGLSIDKVDRIIDFTKIEQDFSCLEGVRTWDLHQHLLGTILPDPAAWVMVKYGDRIAYSIPVTTVPTLMPISIDRIRTLPSEFRSTSPIGIASHVAIITEFITELTIFILAD